MPLNSTNKYSYLIKGEFYKLEFAKGCGISAVQTTMRNYALKARILTKTMHMIYLGEIGVEWEHWDEPHYMHKFFCVDSYFCFSLESLCEENNQLQIVKLS